MAFFRLLLAFAPWLAFLIIAQGSLLRLKLGLVVALALSVVMGVTRLHRGIILWVGLLFFSSATVAVALLDNAWTARHMGVLASSALATGAWITIAIRKPFTLDYALEHTDPSLWNSPVFIRTNMILTAVWASVFTLNAVLALGKMEHFVLPEVGYEVISYTFLIGTAVFTTWYPGHLRRVRRMA